MWRGEADPTFEGPHGRLSRATHSPLSPPKKVGGKYDRETYQKAKKLYSKGYSIKEISKELGVPATTLGHWLRYGMGEYEYLNKTRNYTLSEYYRAIQLYNQGYTLTEIHKIMGIQRNTIRNWLKRGKRPKDISSENIGRYSVWVERHHPYNDEYHKILYNPEKWPFLAYLYGATLTDGTLYKNLLHHRYAIRITGEKIFLERVNHAIDRIINKRYSIFKDQWEDRYIIEIPRKSLYHIMKLGIQKSKTFIEIVKYNERTKRAFILGIVDGDGSYNRRGRLVLVSKLVRWWLISLSGYLLRTLGIRYRWILVRNIGKERIIKDRYRVVVKDRFGWYCREEEFLTKIGPTIKITKRKDLPLNTRELLSKAEDPLK